MSKRKAEFVGNDEMEFEPFVKDALIKQDNSSEQDNNRYRSVVCSFWLTGRCISGEEQCTYLHKFDKSKMIGCKHGSLCKIKNCPLKHMEENAMQECLYYRQGFCMKGPDCFLRHVKRRPEECPQEGNFEACAGALVQPGSQLSLALQDKIKRSNAQNENFKTTICSHWLRNGTCGFNDDCHFAHGEAQINDLNQGPESADDAIIYDPTRHDLSEDPVVPYTLESKVSYFLLQVPDMQALTVCKRRGVWQVTVRMASEINAALKSSPDGVLAFMCIRSYRGIYGIVQITGMVPPAMAGSLITPEFQVKWVRTLRVAVRTVAQMKFNTGMFVGKTASDGRFNSDIGYDILLICYRKPSWDWTAPDQISQALEGIPDGEMVYSQPSLHGKPDQLFDDDWIDRMVTTTMAYVNAFQRNRNMLHTNAVMSTQDRYGNFGGNKDVGNDYYTGDEPGFIFCANNTMQIQEMIERKLFGVPANMSDIVIHPGAPLFLCDLSTQLLFGIFTSQTAVSHNIDPKAFVSFEGGPSHLPIQLRVIVAHECSPIALTDDEIRKNIFIKGPKFGHLDLDITKKLANLFAKRAGLQIGGVGGARMESSRIQQAHGRSGAPIPGMVSTNYKPPFKYFEEVPLDLNADSFQIKRLVLGKGASLVRQIINDLGDEYTIKIRIRGIGSGYPEGPEAKELQEPLHFNVCAENENLLLAVVERVKALVERARSQLQK
jgi:cleavage and polyadenylation specificity factor subunit 4